MKKFYITFSKHLMCKKYHRSYWVNLQFLYPLPKTTRSFFWYNYLPTRQVVTYAHRKSSKWFEKFQHDFSCLKQSMQHVKAVCMLSVHLLNLKFRKHLKTLKFYVWAHNAPVSIEVDFAKKRSRWPHFFMAILDTTAYVLQHYGGGFLT